MSSSYNSYYQQENLFGQAYPELLAFFNQFESKGKVLDLGCGQGRDAIPLARMGFEVKAIDSSEVGIEQIKKIVIQEGLSLSVEVADIFSFEGSADFDFILLDSMFHFAKKDKEKECRLLEKLFSNMKQGAIMCICIQITTKKEKVLGALIAQHSYLRMIREEDFLYTFHDQSSGHTSTSDYRMICLEKVQLA
ncbi:MAG: class I SAM-dependent methyltransferase [Bacteroidia bacterium]|nr:class I SAM-dependent methyltransferase [Bacteroidia bacterium]